MRIIGGYLKGKKISFLQSSITRPLRDMVKENIFNILEHSKLIKLDIKEAKILDLYSGVGSFGFECISRGAKSVNFVEKDKIAFDNLEKNLKSLKITANCTVNKTRTSSYLNSNYKNKYDVIFLDPPFKENAFLNDLKIIKSFQMYNEKHLVIIHREKGKKDDFEDKIKPFLIKEYGRSRIIMANFS